jgi:electron transfer flavoprotein beta subunit
MKQIPDLQQLRIKDKKPVLAGVPMTFGQIDKRAARG